MESPLEPQAIDSEKLQNAIDMSFAHAYDLVASWMSPPKESTAVDEARRLVENKEFEEFSRRPPRLGLGAPIPNSSTTTRKDMQLAKKLTGKRTSRDEADQPSPTTIANGSRGRNEGAPSTDDEDSRSNMTSKKPKIAQNPFERKKKKGPQYIIGDLNQKAFVGGANHTRTSSTSTDTSLSTPPTHSPGKGPSFTFAINAEAPLIKSPANAQLMHDSSNATSSRTSNTSGSTSSTDRTPSPSSSRLSPSKSNGAIEPATQPKGPYLPLLNLHPLPDVDDTPDAEAEANKEGKKKRKKRRRRKSKPSID